MAPQQFLDEEDRVRELHSYDILDTVPEKELNDIVELASSICNTPIAQITLIDNKRQWIKATFGLSGGSTGHHSFCNDTIQTPHQLFEVTDSTRDQRFDSNPYVTGDPYICFYAGSPLVTPNLVSLHLRRGAASGYLLSA